MKDRKTPMRRCVGCMESKPKNTLTRITCYEEQVSVDFSGRAKGRGIYLCRNRECIDKAFKKKALQRGLQCEMDQNDLDRIYEELIGDE